MSERATLSVLDIDFGVSVFNLEFGGGRNYKLHAHGPDELRQQIKQLTMGKLIFEKKNIDSPYELDLSMAFNFTLEQIKENAQRLMNESKLFSFTSENICCTKCEETFRDYNGCLWHITKHRKKKEENKDVS